MLKFYITAEERNRASKMAEELHLSRSNPPGQHPYVWTSGIGAVGVDYWYGYGSAEAKVGSIWFRSRSKEAGPSSQMVECTTEISHHPPGPTGKALRVRITDLEEHKKLAECFFRELLRKDPEGQEIAAPQDVIALKRRIEELDALNHVATILHSTHDPQLVLDLAIGRIATALRAEGASLLLWDDATGELVFTVAVGPVADRLRGRRLAAGQGIAGWVAKSGESVMAPDVSADPRFLGRVDQASSFVTHSILCAPLKTNQGVIGVVELVNSVDGHPFSRADLQLLETVALHAAAVIEIARLLERERELTALLASSKLTEELSGPREGH